MTPRALLGGAFALILLMAAMLWMSARPQPQLASVVERAPAAMPTLQAVVADAVKPAPLVYRYSVIPGGVRSASELVAALARDPAIRAHFADVNASAMRAITVDKARMVHVSYRIGDKIYWTRNKVRLVEGEMLLTDGKHLVRARCGNRIADEVDGMMLESDPATEELQAQFAATDEVIEQHSNLHAAVASVGQGQAQGLRGNSATASGSLASPLDGGWRNPGRSGIANSSVPGFMSGPGATIPVGAVNLPAAGGNNPADAIVFDPLPGAATPPGLGTPGMSAPNDPGAPGTPGQPGIPNTPNPPVTPVTPITPITPNVPTTPPGITTPSTPVLDPETPDILTPKPPLVFAPPPTAEPLPPVAIDTPGGSTRIPEPGSIALFALAGLALSLVRRRASLTR